MEKELDFFATIRRIRQLDFSVDDLKRVVTDESVEEDVVFVIKALMSHHNIKQSYFSNVELTDGTKLPRERICKLLNNPKESGVSSFRRILFYQEALLRLKRIVKVKQKDDEKKKKTSIQFTEKVKEDNRLKRNEKNKEMMMKFVNERM